MNVILDKTEAALHVVALSHKANAFACASGLVRRPIEFCRLLRIDVTDDLDSYGGLRRHEDTSNWIPAVWIGLGYAGRYNRALHIAQCRSGALNARGWAAKQAVSNGKNDVWSYYEYPHINNKPGIGGFSSDDPLHHLAAIVCHELAHAVTAWNSNGQKLSHGAEWQSIYKKMRRLMEVPQA